MEDLLAAVEHLERSPHRLELAKALGTLGAPSAAARQPTEACAATPGPGAGRGCGAQPSPIACGRARSLGRQATQLGAQRSRGATPSERRVVELAAEGQTNRDIAQGLFVTPKTVEVHLSNSYRKLGIRSRGSCPTRWRRRILRWRSPAPPGRRRRGRRGDPRPSSGRPGRLLVAAQPGFVRSVAAATDVGTGAVPLAVRHRAGRTAASRGSADGAAWRRLAGRQRTRLLARGALRVSRARASGRRARRPGRRALDDAGGNVAAGGGAGPGSGSATSAPAARAVRLASAVADPALSPSDWPPR